MKEDAPIGIFDSGVGGISVLRAIRACMPSESILYVADQYHVPYGLRSLTEVREFSVGICQYLIHHGAKIIVIACNAASAAALKTVRKAFPSMSFVGMEPAVKPAAENSQTRVVGILATPVTFEGELYASLVARYGQELKILQYTCPGLVAQIEKGELDSEHTRRILEDGLLPMMENHVDAVVLGCTHYPLVIPLIQEIVGPDIQVIDPAPAIARQTQRLLDAAGMLSHAEKPGQIHFMTTGLDPRQEERVQKLAQEPVLFERIQWNNGLLESVTS